MIDKVLIEYAEKFSDNFPIFYVKHLDEDAIIKIVQGAIDTNVPYIAKYQDNVDY